MKILFFLCLVLSLSFCSPAVDGIRTSERFKKSNINSKTAQVINKLQKIYAPIYKSKGQDFTIYIEEVPVDGFVMGGGRNEPDDKTRSVFVRRGFLNHELTNPDSVAFILCHEIGHHHGGGRYYTYAKTASEGQAEYYAAAKCMRKYLKDLDNKAYLKTISLNPGAIKICNKNWGASTKESFVCQRTIAAGKIFIESVYKKRPVINVSTPATNIVSMPNDNYLKPQCRLDTIVHASVCSVSDDIEMSADDALAGTCNITDGHQVGLRPTCWFNEEMALEAINER